jgi:hypothetical protein
MTREELRLKFKELKARKEYSSVKTNGVSPPAFKL